MSVKAYMFINANQKELTKVRDALKVLPFAKSVETVSGMYDIVAEVEADSIEEVRVAINEHIITIAAVERVVTSFVMESQEGETTVSAEEVSQEEQPVPETSEKAQVPVEETRIITRKPFVLYETLENHLNNLPLSIQGGRIIALNTGRRIHITHIEIRSRLHESDDLIDVVVKPIRVLDDENVSVLDGSELALTDLEGNVVDDTAMVEGVWRFENVLAGEYRLKLYHSTNQFMFLDALRTAVRHMKEESPNSFTIPRKELGELRDDIYDLLVDELDAQVTDG